MKILLIDNHRDLNSWGAESLRRAMRASRGTQALEIHIRRSNPVDLPPSSRDFDAVVLSGSATSCLDNSPWVTTLTEFIRNTVANRTPLLGVCFGHQMIARALEGERTLGTSASPEYGWTTLEKTSENPLVEGLPSKFISFSSHREEVRTLSPSFDVFARSANCAIQAFQKRGAPVWGIQFHPEKDIDDSQTVFAEQKKANPRAKLLRPKESSRLYQPEVGHTLFANFLKSAEIRT